MNKAEMKQKKAQKEAKLESKKSAMKGVAAKAAKLLALLLVPAFLSGCATQPSRSQTQTFKDCNFYVLAAPPAPATNAVADAAAPRAPSPVGDILSQNMMIETGGNESNTASSTPTTTVPIDMAYGGTSGVDSLLGAAASRLKASSGKTSTSDAPKASAAAKTAAGCPGGSCDKVCPDGSCQQ